MYPEMHRFISAMTSLAGIQTTRTKVKHHVRQFGESKYGPSRIYPLDPGPGEGRFYIAAC